jgi:hypothetical protein
MKGEKLISQKGKNYVHKYYPKSRQCAEIRNLALLYNAVISQIKKKLYI